jgi:hypothetical protein
MTGSTNISMINVLQENINLFYRTNHQVILLFIRINDNNDAFKSAFL